MKNLIQPLLILIGIVVVVVIVGFYVSADVEAPVQGMVEVGQYRVSSKVPARVKQLLVKEGDTVHKGDTLAILDAPDVLAKLSQAQAATEAASAVERKAQKGAREEQIRAAYEMWQKANAALDVAEKSWTRISRLQAEGVVSQQKLDEVTAQRDAARATAEAARAQYDMAKNGAEREDIEAATAQAQRARGAVQEVSTYLDETVLLATEDGEVTEIFPKEGELVGSGAPIMNVETYSDLWVTFNVREDQLKQFGMGAEVKADIPALGAEQVPMKVYYVKDIGSYAVWKSTKSRSGYDMKTFEVRCRLVNAMPEGLRAGMSVLHEQ